MNKEYSKSELTKIVYRNIDDLSNYEKNARTHSKDQIEQISKSITNFGYTNPILIDEHNVIIAGHARTMAVKSLQMSSNLALYSLAYQTVKKLRML